MERYWTLQYLQQQQLQELDATVIKSFPGEAPVVRAVNLPLVLNLHSAPPLERGALVRVRLGSVDNMALDVSASFLALLDAPSAPEEDSGDEELSAGPLTIAMDLDEATESDNATTTGGTASAA
jgi:exoribonuclease-2